MKKILYILVISLLLINIVFSCLSVVAQNNVTVDIRIQGQKNMIVDGKKSMVAGIWHYVNITSYNNYNELSLVFYKGTSTPSDKNVTNYYNWKYSKNDANLWQDLIKYDNYEYMQTDHCSVANNVYSFYIGIADTLPNVLDYKEEWTMEIHNDENLLHSEVFYVEKPKVGVALSGDTINFGIDPFTEMKTSKEGAFSILNKGNLPIAINVDYGSNYEEYVDMSNNNVVISPSGKSTHDVTINSDSWKPGLISITGSGGGKVPDELLILTNAMVNFNSFLDPGIPTINIFIGHGTHELIQIPNTDLTFQYYKQTLSLKEDETRDLMVYISGKGNVKSLDIWMDDRSSGVKKVDESNITISQILDDDGKEIISPIRNILSSDAREYVVTIKLKAIRSGTDSFLRYKLEYIEDDGEVKESEYFTKISVQGLASEEDLNSEGQDDGSNMSIFVGLIVILAFGYIIISHIRRRRR